ncbi:MAG: hypothetical protein ACHQUB_00975 [Candidatus Saccharimonadia bacterium]
MRYLTSFVASVILMLGISSNVVHADSSSLCDSNSVVYCGASSQSELISKLYNGDGRDSGDNISQIYLSSGIQITNINQTVMGEVNNLGQVSVNGQVVASNVWQISRANLPNSRSYGNGYAHPLAGLLNAQSSSIYVLLNRGAFAWGIISSNGNPVIAAPIPTPVVATTPAPAAITKPIPRTGPANWVIDMLGLLGLSLTISLYRESSQKLRFALLSQ